MDLHQGQIINNTQLCKIFKCSTQGGMRRSNKTNTLVLVSNHVKSIYDDKWIDNVLHYTGTGKIGDQSLSFNQNQTLNNSINNGVIVHLFEVFKEKEYFYQGIVKLHAEPYQDSQIDEKENLRLVWMFPLKIIDSNPAELNIETLVSIKEIKLKKARKLSSESLKKIVENRPNKKPGKRKAESETFERDQNIVEYAIRRANGRCELCENVAPFNKLDGTAFLEVHHIHYLRSGGNDTIDNVTALCPNCHRKMHALNINADVEKLKRKAELLLII